MTAGLEVPYEPDLELEVAVQVTTNPADWRAWANHLDLSVFYGPARRVVEVALAQPWTHADVDRRLADVALVAGIDPVELGDAFATFGGTLRRAAVHELARLAWRRKLAMLAEALHTAALTAGVDDLEVIDVVDAIAAVRVAQRPASLTNQGAVAA